MFVLDCHEQPQHRPHLSHDLAAQRDGAGCRGPARRSRERGTVRDLYAHANSDSDSYTESYSYSEASPDFSISPNTVAVKRNTLTEEQSGRQGQHLSQSLPFQRQLCQLLESSAHSSRTFLSIEKSVCAR